MQATLRKDGQTVAVLERVLLSEDGRWRSYYVAKSGWGQAHGLELRGQPGVRRYARDHGMTVVFEDLPAIGSPS